MEENKNLTTSENSSQAEQGQDKKWLINRLINLSFALVAIFFFVLTKIIVGFGGGSAALVGVMSIFMLGSAVTGLVWNLIRSEKIKFEFYFSAATLLVVSCALFF